MGGREFRSFKAVSSSSIGSEASLAWSSAVVHLCNVLLYTLNHRRDSEVGPEAAMPLPRPGTTF